MKDKKRSGVSGFGRCSCSVVYDWGMRRACVLTMGEYIMHEQLQTRLGKLKKEFVTGQARLQEVERQQQYLRETMLRISGAIQVLEELLTDEQAIKQDGLSETQPVAGQANHITDVQVAKLQTHDYRPSQDKMTSDRLVSKE